MKKVKIHQTVILNPVIWRLICVEYQMIQHHIIKLLQKLTFGGETSERTKNVSEIMPAFERNIETERARTGTNLRVDELNPCSIIWDAIPNIVIPAATPMTELANRVLRLIRLTNIVEQ